MFLTSAAMASPSDAKEEENENDENEKNKAIVGDEAEEDNFERILGDSYETVGIKNASAAAFVTSAMELGLTDVAVLSAVEVEEIPDWQISKSKKATNLDENFESQVTLSLPSAEEKLENDIVFVLDKSTSVQLENEALEMLKELQAQAKKNGAKVKVGVVIFNKEAHKSDFMDLETQYDTIAAAIRENISSGTNLSAGILAGKKMLDEDTQVAAGRKSLVLLSDGITYILGKNRRRLPGDLRMMVQNIPGRDRITGFLNMGIIKHYRRMSGTSAVQSKRRWMHRAMNLTIHMSKEI